MEKTEFDRMRSLDEIAEADEIYTIWRKSREEFAVQFEAFANEQPENIRNILWGYAGAGEMMWQRKLNLACMHMDFMEKK